MAMINNQKFGISKWWMKRSISLIDHDSDVFLAKKMRTSRMDFIAGSSVIKSIKEWLLAAKIIEAKKSGIYSITKFGMSIRENDPDVEYFATWWAIHLNMFFSERNEPYFSFIRLLSGYGSRWVSKNEIEDNIINNISEDTSEGSVISNLLGVLKMFDVDQPLYELGLIDISRDSSKNEVMYRIGKPRVGDEVFLYALALIRKKQYYSRVTVDVKELLSVFMHTALCMTAEDFKLKIRAMENSQSYTKYFQYSSNANLDSIKFCEKLIDSDILLMLIQNKSNHWC